MVFLGKKADSGRESGLAARGRGAFATAAGTPFFVYLTYQRQAD